MVKKTFTQKKFTPKIVEQYEKAALPLAQET